MSDESSRRASLAEIREMERRGELHHNPDAAPGPSLGRDFWKDAEMVLPSTKTAISLRLDPEVLDWFRAQGPGYQTRMNWVLRTYMDAQLQKVG